MTLSTKIRDGWEGDYVSVSRSVRYMATQTLHGHVLISRVDHFFPHGMVRMFRPVVAALAEFDHGRLLQKEPAIRRVRGMTGIATSLLDWIVCHGTLDYSSLGCSIFLLLFFGELFLRRHGVNMTLPTQSLHIPCQKLFLRRCMGFMAVQTTHFVNQRPMDPVLIKCVIHHGAVAPPAQLKPRLLRLQRVGRSGGFVTLCARLIGNRSVHIVEQYTRPTRAMGIMAGRAVRLRHRIIHMLF
jgi:hypothetical protein